jgi:hypothetical protein
MARPAAQRRFSENFSWMFREPAEESEIPRNASGIIFRHIAPDIFKSPGDFCVTFGLIPTCTRVFVNDLYSFNPSDQSKADPKEIYPSQQIGS